MLNKIISDSEKTQWSEVENMNHQIHSTLYIAKEIIVEPGLESEYIKFMNALEKYIQVKYPNYYRNLELYEDKEEKNKFYMTACYNNVDGIYGVIEEIENDITCLYDDVYGERVKRKTIFSFNAVQRLIPQY